MTPANAIAPFDDNSPAALRARLGRGAVGATRWVEAAAALAAGESVQAVTVGMWGRRGWVVLATDVGLRLGRRPRLLGRRRQAAFAWRDLTAVQSGPGRVALTFGDTEVALVGVGPLDEYLRLLEAARAHVGGADKPSTAELRALARLKLGRLLGFGFEATIDALPDRLELGEQVQRLASATSQFDGLLVLTDRRLMLLDTTMRRSNERAWEIRREEIASVHLILDGLRLLLTGGAEVTVRRLAPPGRLEEFAAALGATAG